MAIGCISRAWRDGLSDGRASEEQGRARRDRLQPHHGQGREMGGRAWRRVCETPPAEAAEGKDFVFSCVGNDDDLRSVTIGPDGAFQAMKKGAVFIDNTTASAEVARELAEKAERRRLRLPRRAGLRRPGRRRERRAHRHGRRRRRKPSTRRSR